MPKNKLRIEALGTSISIAISTDEDGEYLARLQEKYQEELRGVQESTGLEDPLKVAILTGFLMCDEREKLRQKGEGGEHEEAERLTLSLISLLDDVLAAGEGEAAAEPAQAGPPAAANQAAPSRRVPDAAPAPAGEPRAPGSEGRTTRLCKLKNEIKNYKWGSPTWIPELLGQKNVARVPWAEMWMGVHPGGPSRIIEGGRKARSAGPLLSQIIDEDPFYYIGEDAAFEYGTLPFLFKVLAAGEPLSIQAHPSREQAREGWDRENQAGIPLDAPERNYKDANHKPEILCALNDFTAMCGFRPPEEIRALLEIFASGADSSLRDRLRELTRTLTPGGGTQALPPLKAFFAALFRLSPDTRRDLTAYAAAQCPRLVEDYSTYRDEWRLVRWFAKLYPGDPGVIAPLYLNLVTLEPGQAVYLPAGVLHAYVNGLGVELMANSDNVLRGGLTSKHIDTGELFRVLTFAPYKPAVLTPGAGKYPTPSREFALSVFSSKGSGETPYPERGPSLVLVTEGELTVSGGGNPPFILKKGESAFIPAGEAAQGLSFGGSFQAYAAGIGKMGADAG